MNVTYQQPRDRKGFTVTALQWDRTGKLVDVQYTPNARLRDDHWPADLPRSHRGVAGELLL